MSVSKINFNEYQEAYIVVDSINEIDKVDFKNYLEMDSPSFLKCEFENEEAFTLYYNYGSRMSLKQVLSQVVGKEDVVPLLKSLTKAFIEGEKKGMKLEHILLGINSIFYDKETKQVSCVYVPVNEGVLPFRPLRLFIKEMLVNMIYSETEEMDWLGNIIRYISRNRTLSYSDFYEFLQIQEGTFEEKAESEGVSEALEEVLRVSEEAAELENKEDAEDKEEEGNLEAEDVSGEGISTVLESIPAAESVSALKAEPEIQKETSEEVVETESENLPEEAEEAPEALLTRRSNHKVYSLDQSEIQIGKAQEMDIVIDDNPAISRHHAVLRRSGSGFVIQDMGSTNHTFVNGILLQAGQEKPLFSGDRILFGNEEFIYKI